jgi:DNA-binding HxlR family transcriptional regulator
MERGFGQFCPVAVACEVFAQRWTPIIPRELFAGAQQFNEIHRGIPLISRPLLARRLRELEAAGVITRSPLPTGKGHRYSLSEAGNEFRSVIDGLGAWGQRWTVRVDNKNLDPGFLLWNMRRRIAKENLPSRRVVVHFKFRGVAATYRGPLMFWLLLERAQVDLCIDDPGFEVDLVIEADVAAMARIWLGDLTFECALRDATVRASGPRPLIKAFPSWLMLSRFAGVPRPQPSALEAETAQVRAQR